MYFITQKQHNILGPAAPPPVSRLHPASSAGPEVQPPSCSSQQVAMDQHNIPGMNFVDELAEYLVELHTQSAFSLTNQQSSTIIGLWQNLEQFDKDRIRYAARHQDRATKKIRQLVLTNGPVMKETTLQLVEVNQTTLVQWHNRRLKAQEVSVLLQGVQLPTATPVATERYSLQDSNHRFCLNTSNPSHLPTTTKYSRDGKNKTEAYKTCRDRVGTISPTNTECSSRPVSTRTILPKPPQPLPVYAPGMVPLLVTVPAVVTTTTSTSTTPVSQSSSDIPLGKRKYTRKVSSNACRSCGEFRTAETGHSQYKGRIYCPKKRLYQKKSG
ncbi:hypothetical protein OJAV_G00200540 [Oryzias javanicus]|uniref:Uncharacterized protein n=1 Tax=Oryzias javanicus TaxID=123683 RepID=A0A3S2MGS9_ORYJA|nr:hypothetical protein OJAV_G00200540 [Oryzias javanicus]